jgi:DnaJ-class molecular chaperone
MSKKADAINKIVLLDLPKDLTQQLVSVVQGYTFPIEECDNCLGSGLSLVTDRLCTKCNGTGEMSV